MGVSRVLGGVPEMPYPRNFWRRNPWLLDIRFVKPELASQTTAGSVPIFIGDDCVRPKNTVAFCCLCNLAFGGPLAGKDKKKKKDLKSRIRECAEQVWGDFGKEMVQDFIDCMLIDMIDMWGPICSVKPNSAECRQMIKQAAEECAKEAFHEQASEEKIAEFLRCIFGGK